MSVYKYPFKPRKRRSWKTRSDTSKFILKPVLDRCDAPTDAARIGVRAGGARGAAAPPVLKIFGQNAYDSGKSTWNKLFIESSFYNTAKWSILKRLNGSVCCRSLDAGICCSFVPNLLANSQKASAL